MAEDLVKYDDREEEEEVELDETIVWNLTPQQIRYCELSAKTRQTKAEIAKIVRTSKNKLIQWDEDPNVIAYIHYLKKSSIKDHREASKKQMSQVRDKIFSDILSRMEMDGDDIISSDEFQALPPTLQKVAMERHHHFTSFKDSAKLMLDFNKTIESMIEEETVEEDQNAFVQAILTRAHMKMSQRRTTEEVFDSNGINRSNRYSIIEMNKDGTIKEPLENNIEDIGDILEVDITTITINRTKE